MFPYSNYSAPLSSFEPYSTQIYSNQEFSNPFPSIGNYYYFSQPSYYQPNYNFGPFLSSTSFTDEKYYNFKPFDSDRLDKINQNILDKNISSSTTDEKITNESFQKYKTQPIRKKGRQLLLLEHESGLKQKKQKFQTKYNQSQYQAEEQNKKKFEEQHHLFLKYRRKNTESNIVNRIYSFLTSEFKNKHEFLKLKLNDHQKQTYLKYLLLVVEAWKGPVKRQLLYGLINVTQSLPAFKVLQKIYETDNALSLQQFQYLNRVLIRTYLSKIAAVSVITSKKMKKIVWKEHLQKIRELNQYFFQFEQTSS